MLKSFFEVFGLFMNSVLLLTVVLIIIDFPMFYNIFYFLITQLHANNFLTCCMLLEQIGTDHFELLIF